MTQPVDAKKISNLTNFKIIKYVSFEILSTSVLCLKFEIFNHV